MFFKFLGLGKREREGLSQIPSTSAKSQARLSACSLVLWKTETGVLGLTGRPISRASGRPCLEGLIWHRMTQLLT